MRQQQRDFSVNCANHENGKYSLDLDVPDGSYLETVTVNGRQIFPDATGLPVASIILKILPDEPPKLEVEYLVISGMLGSH